MKLKILVPFLLILNILLSAQSNPFNFDYDYAQFGYDSTSNYVEFYYSFNQTSFKVITTDSANFIDGVLKFVIIDTIKHDTTVNKEWRVTHQLQDSAEMANKSLIGVISFILPEGNYKTEISGHDFNDTARKKIIKEDFSVIPFLKGPSSLRISDIQLASRIIQDSNNKNSIFYKNSLEIFPIPVSVFGENQPVLFYYNEIYNIDSSIGAPLKCNMLVINSSKNVVHNKNKYLSRSVNSRVEVGSVVVNKLPTDTYTLIVSLIDSAANYGISSSKRFFVYNPSVAASDTGALSNGEMLSSQFGVMSEEELDALFDKSKYVATSNEVNQYKKINTVEGKKEFLYQFWKARDTDASTAKNEYYEQYVSRASLSDQRYGSMTRSGWKSDRGRIYMTYGEPNEIERFPNTTDAKPYEIWYYNELEGGVYFVFADLTGFSDYQLVHSTMRGELRDENWSRRVSSF